MEVVGRVVQGGEEPLALTSSVTSSPLTSPSARAAPLRPGAWRGWELKAEGGGLSSGRPNRPLTNKQYRGHRH